MTRLVIDILSVRSTLVHSDEGRCLRDAAEICDAALRAIQRGPRSPEDLRAWITESALGDGWFPVDEEMKIDGDLQVYLTWISNRKDLAVSVWDARRQDLVKYFSGMLKELTRSGRSYDFLRRSASVIGTVDVTEEFLRELDK